MMNSDKLTPTPYLWSLATFALKRTISEVLQFFGSWKWRHSGFSTRGHREQFSMMNSERSTPTSYLSSMTAFAPSRVLSEILRFSCSRKWRRSDSSARWRRKQFLIMDSEGATPTSYLWSMVAFSPTRIISEILMFFVCRKWRHSNFSARGHRKQFLMMDSERMTPTSYM